MNRNIRNAALAFALLALPGTLAAQEAETCTTTLGIVPTGEVVQVTAEFPNAFGEVIEVEGPIVLASDEQLSMIEMATEETEEAAEELANEEKVSTFWLDVTTIEPGAYALILHNEGGETCEAQIEVEQPGS